MNILLCLYDARLLAMTCELLKRKGVQVMGTGDSSEALETILAGVSFDAMVLDLNSVPLDARRVIPDLRTMNQALPVLITTGGTVPTDAYFVPFRVEWLQRPFSTKTLIAAIERAIILSGTMSLVSFWEALTFAEKVFESLATNSQDETQGAGFVEIFNDRRETVIQSLAAQTGLDRAHLLSNLELGMTLDEHSSRAVADLIFWLKTYGK